MPKGALIRVSTIVINLCFLFNEKKKTIVRIVKENWLAIQKSKTADSSSEELLGALGRLRPEDVGLHVSREDALTWVGGLRCGLPHVARNKSSTWSFSTIQISTLGSF